MGMDFKNRPNAITIYHSYYEVICTFTQICCQAESVRNAKSRLGLALNTLQQPTMIHQHFDGCPKCVVIQKPLFLCWQFLQVFQGNIKFSKAFTKSPEYFPNWTASNFSKHPRNAKRVFCQGHHKTFSW